MLLKQNCAAQKSQTHYIKHYSDEDILKSFACAKARQYWICVILLCILYSIQSKIKK